LVERLAAHDLLGVAPEIEVDAGPEEELVGGRRRIARLEGAEAQAPHLRAAVDEHDAARREEVDVPGRAGRRPALVNGDGGVIPLLVEVEVQVDLDDLEDRRVKLALTAEAEPASRAVELDAGRVVAGGGREAGVGAQEQAGA